MKVRTLAFALALLLALPLFAAAARVQFDSAAAGPRQVEETTEKAIVRDYGAAWQALAQALQQNRADLLDADFVGFARDRFTHTIAEQKQSGLTTRYVDHGHKLEAMCYSPEGSAMQLHDTAQLEIQLLDGGSVIHSENVTLHYLVLMTPTADRWQVRELEAVPKF